MRIQLMSDLHLEFSAMTEFEITESDVLVLAGDILVAAYTLKTGFQLDRYVDFMQKCSDNYKNIIVVAGNHEYYYGDWMLTSKVLTDFYGKWKNVHFLEQQTCVIDNCKFIGATLWTDFNQNNPLDKIQIEKNLNDYRTIYADKLNINTDLVLQRHDCSLDFLKQQLIGPEQKKVVITHHGPSFRSCHPKYANSRINSAYFSNLDGFISHYQPDAWLFGHTHHAHWYYADKTLVACNPRGYQSPNQSEYTGFVTNWSFDLDNMPNIAMVENNYGNLITCI